MAALINDLTIITGTSGRAWMVDFDPESWGHRAVIAYWIVEAAWAHPFWRQYAITAIHLRDIPGVAPARKHHLDATHEIMVSVVNPKHEMQPGDSGGLEGRILTPPNFIGQWRADDDAKAHAAVTAVVRSITVGALSPDTDFRSAWKILFPYTPLSTRPGAIINEWRPINGERGSRVD